MKLVRFADADDDLTCHYCKTLRATTVDHIVPKVIGGPNRWWNRVPACLTCNENKADHTNEHHCKVCRRAFILFRQGVHRVPEPKARDPYRDATARKAQRAERIRRNRDYR